MKEKQAIEILDREKSQHKFDGYRISQYWEAVGCIGAVEHANRLAKAIEEFKNRDDDQDTMHPMDLLSKRIDAEKKLYEALAKYEREK